MQFVKQPTPAWLTLKTGEFDTLEGGVDQARRRVYLELVTKAFNNYFPLRTQYGGVQESDVADERVAVCTSDPRCLRASARQAAPR